VHLDRAVGEAGVGLCRAVEQAPAATLALPRGLVEKRVDPDIWPA
jgi:hypothetical protein